MPNPSLLGQRLTPFAPASAPENIDEMVLQFEGREDELIETMRTMHDRNVAQRARPNVQKTAKFEARAKASISSASELSGLVSEQSGADSDSSGKALGWNVTKCSDTISSKPPHYGSMEDSSGNIYRSPESSVRGGGGGERGRGGDRRRPRRRRQRRQRRK